VHLCVLRVDLHRGPKALLGGGQVSRLIQYPTKATVSSCIQGSESSRSAITTFCTFPIARILQETCKALVDVSSIWTDPESSLIVVFCLRDSPRVVQDRGQVAMHSCFSRRQPKSNLEALRGTRQIALPRSDKTQLVVGGSIFGLQDERGLKTLPSPCQVTGLPQDGSKAPVNRNAARVDAQ